MNDSNKVKKKIDFLITIILVIGIFLAVNFISYRIHFFRWDLTENKVFSISDVSKKTVSELDDVVSVNAYFSEDLPSQMLALRQEVGDILDEYQVASNGNITINFIDPKDDEDLKKDLYMLGIPELQFQVFEKDKRQVVKGYMGIAIKFSGKSESIPVVKQDTRDLEYQITTDIKKVATDSIVKIGVLSSHDTENIESNFQTAYKSLTDLYEVVQVVLDENSAEISPDVSTLIISGAKGEFSETDQMAINSFLIRGGSLIVFQNSINVSNSLEVVENTTNITDMLAEYGINIDKNLIGDERSGFVPISNGFFTMPTKYAFWPMIQEDGFNKDYPAVASLSSLIFPWVSSLSVDQGKMVNAEFSYLLSTTDKAWSAEGGADIGIETKAGSPKSAYNLAVVVNSGLINVLAEGDEKEVISGRIAVVGDSDFITDNFLQANPDNLTFFQNLVDSMSLDNDLINIRSKVVTSRPIKEDLTDADRATMRYSNIFGVTAVVIAFGMVRYYWRRKTKFVDKI